MIWWTKYTREGHRSHSTFERRQCCFPDQRYRTRRTTPQRAQSEPLSRPRGSHPDFRRYQLRMSSLRDPARWPPASRDGFPDPCGGGMRRKHAFARTGLAGWGRKHYGGSRALVPKKPLSPSAVGTRGGTLRKTSMLKDTAVCPRKPAGWGCIVCLLATLILANGLLSIQARERNPEKIVDTCCGGVWGWRSSLQCCHANYYLTYCWFGGCWGERISTIHSV